MANEGEPFWQDAELVLHFTREEAARLNQPRIGPDHLVFGLARAWQTGAGQLLAAEGADLDLAREWATWERQRDYMRRHEPWTPPGFTPALRAILEHAANLARGWRQPVRSEHLLLACLAHEGGRGVSALYRLGVSSLAWDRLWTAALDALQVPTGERTARPKPDYGPSRMWMRREGLRAVTPIARQLERGDHQLTLLSLEEYADGFVLRCDYTLNARPPHVELEPADLDQRFMPPRLRARLRAQQRVRMAREHLVFTAHDDLGGEYVPAEHPSGGGGSGGQDFWRADYNQGFLPALAEGATILLLAIPEVRWEREPFHLAKDDPIRVGPLGWTVEVSLSLRQAVTTKPMPLT